MMKNPNQTMPQEDITSISIWFKIHAMKLYAKSFYTQGYECITLQEHMGKELYTPSYYLVDIPMLETLLFDLKQLVSWVTKWV